MLKNDSLTITVVVTTIEVIAIAVNIFLIIVIWKHSPKSIGIFKNYMLRMAIVYFFFSLFFGWICQPVPMLPLSGLITAGPVKYFGMIGAKFIMTLCSAVLSLNFVNEFCLYRTLLFYKRDKSLGFYTTCPGILYCNMLFNVSPCSFISILIWFLCMNYEELALYAQLHNISLEPISSNTSFLAVDFDKPLVMASGALTVSYLSVIKVSNIIASRMVYKKLNATRRTMSKETFCLQKSLTVILIAQAAIPLTAITLPYGSLILAVWFGWTPIINSELYQRGCLFIFGTYPLLNSLFCIFCIRAYRNFTLQTLKWVLFCWTADSSTEVVVAYNTVNSR